MHGRGMLIGLLAAGVAAATASAQAPTGEIDAHVAAARTAAGQDYRATFVNLCFSGANPAAARAGGAPAPGARTGGAAAAAVPAGRAGAGRGAGGTPDRANWYASPYKI